MSRLRHLLLAAFTMLSLAAVAQQAEMPKKSFLWQVKSGNHTLYLFGAPGLGNGDLYPLGPWVEAAYTRAQVLAVEADVSDEKRLASQTSTMFYGKDDGLEQHLSKELYEEVYDFHATQGLSIAGPNHMKPYALAFGLMNQAAHNAGLDPSYDAPFYFTAKAQADHKPIVEIVGVPKELDTLEQMAMPMQEEFLKAAIEQSAAGNWPQQLQNEVSAWKSGDIDYYTELELKSYAGMAHGADVRHYLVANQHPLIVDKLTSYLDSGKITFAVLAAPHFVGPDNLIDQLRKRGYAVDRL